MYNSAKQLGNIQTPHTATEIESSKKKKKEIFTNKTWYIIWVQKSSKLPRNYQKSRFQINLIQSCKRSASTAPRIPRKPFSQAKANLGPSTSAEVEVNENFHPKMNQCQAWKGSILREMNHLNSTINFQGKNISIDCCSLAKWAQYELCMTIIVSLLLF